MKRLLILFLLLISSVAWAGSTTVVVGQGGAGAPPPDGPNAWYYAGGNDTYTAADGWGNANQGFWSPITITTGGSLTKVGVKICDQLSSSGTVKLGVYYLSGATWTRHECFSLAFNNNAAGWLDGTLATPLTVATSDVVRISIFSDNEGFCWENDASGGFWIYDSYANACTATEASDGAEALAALRVYID